MANRKLRVFLCHASQDKPIVRELYQRLLAEGWIDPWLDKEKLLPGQEWELEIEKSVESADAVIVCLSKAAITKEGYIQKELKKILDVADEKPEGTIFVIPVRLDNCDVPRRLQPWQYEDYFLDDQKSKAYDRIVHSLRLRLGYEPPAPVEVPRGEVPIHYRNMVFLNHNVSAPKIYKDGVQRIPLQVIVDSFNERLLDDVERVIYHLHPAFPRPDREVTERKEKFVLKTGARGEFNLSADIYFKGYEKPMTLYRYINLQNF